MLFYLTPRFDNPFKRDAVDLRLSSFPCRVLNASHDDDPDLNPDDAEEGHDDSRI